MHNMREVKVKTLIVDRNTPGLASNQAYWLHAMEGNFHNEIVIHKCSEEPFRGKCYGHNMALQENKGDYDYYWFNQPDLDFLVDMDCLGKLIKVMEMNPKVALASPADISKPVLIKNGYRWHPVARCDYLSLLIRSSVIEEIGFLNPEFLYSWGAIHEYAYKVYSKGWLIAYCDYAKVHHLGGTTYGQKGMISRKEYRRRAMIFAQEYLTEKYGRNWDRRFASSLPYGVENTYTISKRIWRNNLWDKFILRRLSMERKKMDKDGAIRLNLGSGKRKREGWVNIDADEAMEPDVVAEVQDLNMFEDSSVDEVECCHLFEHFTYHDAIRALGEWYRVLKPGGKLELELPNLDRCVEILYKKEDKEAERFAIMGLYGAQDDVERFGIFMTHKYGWTPETLKDILEGVGFRVIRRTPITQTFRKATAYNRDMRLECLK